MSTPPPPQHVALTTSAAQAINDRLERQRLELLDELKVVEGQIAALRTAEPVHLGEAPPTEGELEAQAGQAPPPPEAIAAAIDKLKAMQDPDAVGEAG